MNGREFRYLKRRDALALGDVVLPRWEHYSPSQFVASVDLVGRGTLASMRRSLMAAGDGFSRGMPDDEALREFAMVQLTVTPTDDNTDPGEVWFQLTGAGRLQVEVLVGASDPADDRHELIRDIAVGFCSNRTVELVDTFTYENDGWMIHHVTLSLLQRGATVQDGYDQAISLYELYRHVDAADFSERELVKSVLRGGRPELLIGRYESAELECKRRAYDLSNVTEKIEFSQDVARFANAERGGLLVLGLKTKSDAVGDRITGISPLGDIPKASRLHKVLDQLLFPPVEGLTVELAPATPGGDAAIVLVDIPSQPEELKPFLVAGALVNRKVEGAFISIVRRRGEHSIPISPAAVHAALAAGRALLRGPTAFGAARVEDGDRAAD